MTVLETFVKSFQAFYGTDMLSYPTNQKSLLQYLITCQNVALVIPILFETYNAFLLIHNVQDRTVHANANNNNNNRNSINKRSVQVRPAHSMRISSRQTMSSAKTNYFSGTLRGATTLKLLIHIIQQYPHIAMTICSSELHKSGETYPMVYINPMFCTLTGYRFHECHGKNPRFLQGKQPLDESSQQSVEVIRNALSKQQECQVTIKNYKKNNTMFMNLLGLVPIFDEYNRLIYVIGLLFDVTNTNDYTKKSEELKQTMIQLPRVLLAEQDAREDSLYNIVT